LPTATQEKCDQNGCGPDCPLVKFFPQANYVPPKPGSGLRLVIAEAPGQDEDLQRIPLVGPSGRWFDSLCRTAGIKRDELTLFNVLPCRPPDNVFPTDNAARSYISKEDADAVLRHCISCHLRPLLDSKPWSRVDLLGDKALVACTGLSGGILQWRGSPVSLVGETKPRAIPTLHPAYIARDQSMIPVVINDLKKSCIVPPEFYNIEPTLEDVRNFTATEFASDIECDIATRRITMVGLCAKPFYVMVVPFRGPYIHELKRIFAAAKRVYGHNLVQFDVPLLAENGVKLSDTCEQFDTMLAQHLLQPDLAHDLQFVASIFCNKPATWKSGDKSAPLYWEWRNARDTDVTLQCGKVLLPQLKMERLYDLYSLVQVPLARVCHEMSVTGFKTDPGRIAHVREKLLAEMAEAETLLPEKLRTTVVSVNKRQKAPLGTLGKSGKPVKYIHVPAQETVVPWRASGSIEEYLYVDLGLPQQLHAKTKKPTSDKTALEKLERRCRREGKLEFAQHIAAIRKLRQASTLISGFLQDEKASVGRVNAHFNVHGTSSGRLSSSDPNLQNQPEAARYIYVPSHADWQLCQFDYSQGENRLTAFFANDRERLNRLSDPKFSEHKWNAAQLFDMDYADVVKDNSKDAPYGKAKRVGHGLNYGMGPQKISNLFDLELKEVKDLVAKWKTVNHETVEWQQRTAKQAESDGYLTTPFGRKRWFYTQSLYTESLSFVPQSTLADVIYRAMIALMYERINWPREKAALIARVVEPLPRPARLLVQVHDSLVIECPRALTDDVVEVVHRVMTQGWPELGGLSIPVECEVAAPGESWGEMEPYKPLAVAA